MVGNMKNKFDAEKAKSSIFYSIVESHRNREKENEND